MNYKEYEQAVIGVADFTARANTKALDAFNGTGLPQLFKASNVGNGVEILMYDIIGTPECNSKLFAQALDDAHGAPVTIRLSSPGGNVFAGWEVYNSLKNYTGDTTVIVDGVCASIATVVALGADHVLTQDTSLWMVHNAWLGTIGNANELRDTADILDKIDANIRDIYATKTGQAAELWGEYMAKETWFGSSEVVALGLADAIAEAPAKAASAFQPMSLADPAPEPSPEPVLPMQRALQLRRAKVLNLI